MYWESPFIGRVHSLGESICWESPFTGRVHLRALPWQNASESTQKGFKRFKRRLTCYLGMTLFCLLNDLILKSETFRLNKIKIKVSGKGIQVEVRMYVLPPRVNNMQRGQWGPTSKANIFNSSMFFCSFWQLIKHTHKLARVPLLHLHLPLLLRPRWAKKKKRQHFHQSKEKEKGNEFKLRATNREAGSSCLQREAGGEEEEEERCR